MSCNIFAIPVNGHWLVGVFWAFFFSYHVHFNSQLLGKAFDWELIFLEWSELPADFSNHGTFKMTENVSVGVFYMQT